MTPVPVINRWLITGYNHAWPTFNTVTEKTLYITVQTDVPVHLWLCWTEKEIRIHDGVDVQRGYGFKWDPHWCFVELKWIDQEEPGDTIYHHFKLPGWYECRTLYWLFLGYVGGVISGSSSPLFNAHYLTYIKDESMRHIDLVDKEVAGVIDHADASVTPAKLSFNLPQVIATYQQVGLSTHLIEWAEFWSHITIRLSFRAGIDALYPILQMNEDFAAVYAIADTYTRAWQEPAGWTAVMRNNWPVMPFDIEPFESGHFLGELFGGSIYGSPINILCQASGRYAGANLALQGTLILGGHTWARSLRVTNLHGLPFHLQAMITGLNV